MDVETEHAHVHHHKSGHRWVDLAIPLAALFVSFISIWIAWHHGQVMQQLVDQNARLVQANSKPHVTLSQAHGVDDRGVQNYTLSVRNGGVGPAEIRTAEVLYNGRAVHNSRELLRLCCNIDSSEYRFGDLVDAMLQPGQQLNYLLVTSRPDPQITRGLPALYKAFAAGTIETRVCYCSVFDECWTKTSIPRSRPVQVEQCRPPRIGYTH